MTRRPCRGEEPVCLADGRAFGSSARRANNSIARRLPARGGVPAQTGASRTAALHEARFYRGDRTMKLCKELAAVTLLAGCFAVQATGLPESTPQPLEGAASIPGPDAAGSVRPTSSTSEEGTAARPAPRSWDAVLGFTTSYAPEYPGSSRRTVGVTPGGWVRWGRVSIASRSSFVARSGEPVSGGGLRFDLSPNERLRVGLSLRHDGGRDESDSADLRGLGDVRATLRLRLGVSYPMDEGWRLASSWTVDALGRGGGTVGELALSRSVPLAPTTSGGITVATSAGNRRHMRSYYGVNDAQSAASGYPVYEPGAGWRDVSTSVGVRHELSRHWFTFGGLSVARLVGEAAASPLVREPTSWAVNVGLAYRF